MTEPEHKKLSYVTLILDMKTNVGEGKWDSGTARSR